MNPSDVIKGGLCTALVALSVCMCVYMYVAPRVCVPRVLVLNVIREGEKREKKGGRKEG